MTISTKIEKNNNDLIIIIPKEICSDLDIKEGTELDMEVFMCSGEKGVRIRCKKTDN